MTRLFLFYLARSSLNALKRRLGRLKQPRYLVGLVFGLLYFWGVFFRPGRTRPRGRATALLALSPDVLSLLLLAGSAALACFVLLTWLFGKGKAALPLSEGEVQFLFPAPVPRRAVIHFALLRSQLPIFFASVVLTFVLGINASFDRLRTGIGTWVMFSALNFHALALGFTKAAWEEQAPKSRRAKTAVYAGVIALLALLTAAGANGVLEAGRAMAAGRGTSVADIEHLLRASPLGSAAFALLLPFRVLLAPLLAASTSQSLTRLPGAIAIAALLYGWVLTTNVHFEEATLAGAARRAEARARKQSGRLAGLPPDRKRRVVPFRLGPTGRAEVAVLWKNLLAWQRLRLSTFAAILGGLVLLVGLAALLLPTTAKVNAAVAATALMAAAVGLAIGVFGPLAMRNDLRGDLEQAPLLKLWPIPAERVVAAELAAPWLVSTLWVWGGVALLLSISAGRALHHRLFDPPLLAPVLDRPLPPFAVLLPVGLAVALLLPVLNALTFTIQNAAVLAFPAWFPPGTKRTVGLEATGMRMLSFLATTLLLVIALVPSAILSLPVVFFGRAALGFWAFTLAAPLAALPVAAEVVLGVLVLARLLRRFDPALDLEK